MKWNGTEFNILENMNANKSLMCSYISYGISHPNKCPTVGVSNAMVCTVLSVCGKCINKNVLLFTGESIGL